MSDGKPWLLCLDPRAVEQHFALTAELDSNADAQLSADRAVEDDAARTRVALTRILAACDEQLQRSPTGRVADVLRRVRASVGRLT